MNWTIVTRKVLPGRGPLPSCIVRVGELAGSKEPAREEFYEDLWMIIEVEHEVASDDPALLKGVKRIARLARQLKEALSNSDLSRNMRVKWFNIAGLNDELRQLERLNKLGRPKKWAKANRDNFIFNLLDAVDDAGGHLGTNPHSRNDSLVEAVNLLRPHLPALFRNGLGEDTLRILKRTWVKNRKNSFKKRKS